MDKKWPFGFFVYSNLDEKEGAAKEETTETKATVEEVKVVWAQTPASVVIEVEDEADDEVDDDFETIEEDENDDDEDDEVDDDDNDENLPDLEEELELALEEAHRKGLKKQRLVTGISAGVALLGAVGLATGLAIHNHFKKNNK